ncbi:hypothetical protein PC9H_001507 [Pleurotus ostreatus]|uniref:Senescence domain-containing protein n=1 Tax=Pleurotus ostreatus TaxID=5322 RepID=A0A8H7DYS0_PLEOS|nr:uncharacterized protein PC9H_001507 [Pleurotus ostreatus]KAF7441158.1 hypothetical protein PC9H_001507 [Pleurotus ostreatus]
MTATHPEAFLLLTLENATVRTPTNVLTGVLGLQCVTVTIDNDRTAAPAHDVFLVLQLNGFETPIDPARTITHERSENGTRTYTFHRTEFDNTQLVISITPPEKDQAFVEDLETFEGILAQYADFRGYTASATSVNARPSSIPPPYRTDYSDVGTAIPGSHGDLRGHLILVNEDNGEVVGEFDRQFAVKEDPQLREKGHENDPVYIEVPDQTLQDEDANARELFARAVPPDQENWITKSATVISHTISATTNLLLTTVTAASNYYINHSTPSPHASSSALNRTTPGSATELPPPPPRALVFLTSESTRKGLSTVHAITGQAVQVSTKTVSVINDFVRRAVGGKPKSKESRLYTYANKNQATPFGSPIASPSPVPANTLLSPTAVSRDGKPPLPPRRSPSPSIPSLNGPPLPPRGPSPANQPLSNTARLILSADLILATLDHSTRQVLDTGTERFGAVMGHKYGPEAKESSLMFAGSARNVALVYVDMRGIGRKAILKQAGMQFVKARVHK